MQTGDGLFKAIETFSIGDEVLAAGVDLNWSAKPVVFSSGTTVASLQRFTVLVVYQNTAIAVTSDHLFLLEDRTLKRADRLAPTDVLVSPQGEAVPITSVHVGDYYAGFHHIATSLDSPDTNLDGRLLNTNGVISADYVVQLRARSEDVTGFNPPDDLPVVGSPEYVAQFGESSRQAPQLPQGFNEPKIIVDPQVYNAPDLAPNSFVPAETIALHVPDDACSFISKEEAARKAQDPKRAFSDPAAREWSEALVHLHRAWYPDITYHVDWTDEDVNAYAWVENGVRHVALKGGLIRHMKLETEAIALILAHEIGHHYGGDPKFPGGLSCEGQADYYGVRDAMRKVWFGFQYITVTDAAIAQMANFFNVPNVPTAPGGSAGCSHPPGACRIATYHAAVSLSGKPACAS
ncbi:M48 family metalloprotease [Nonomuraea typhae]|uniref:M48 family metalloprotease n=1 Tax=Nonomuraea typhae TaxID=2603600 RepID=A0ABW7YQV7_9ACTN